MIKQEYLVRMQQLKRGWLWGGISLGVMILTELIGGVLEWFLTGEVTLAYFIIGLVVSGTLAPLGCLLVSYLMAEFAKNQQREFAFNAQYANKRLAIAIESSQMVIWEYDFAHDTFQYDPALLSSLKSVVATPPQSLLAWITLVHPDERDAFMAHIEAMLLSDNPVLDIEYRLNQGEGRWEWTHSRGTVIQRDFEGRPKLLVGSTANIHKRKQAELSLRNALTTIIDAQEALAAREEIYRSIVEQANDGIVMVEVETQRFIEFNDAACSSLGYSREEFALLTIADIQALHSREGIALRLNDIVSQQELVFETLHKHKDGSLRDVRVSNKFLSLHGKSYVAAIVTDITDSKQAELELSIAATAFESQEGMMITDAQQRLLRVNQAFTHITGYSTAEVIGRSPRLLSSGRQGKDFYDAMWDSIRSNGAWEGEIWNQRKNGEVYPEHLMVTVVKNKLGQVTNYVGALTDSTERAMVLQQLRITAAELVEANHQIEEERAMLANRVNERTAQLREASHAKDSFLATMSHEIRTPLSGLLGMLELLSVSGLNDKQQEMFSVARNSGKSLLHIVDDILDWSKIEAGKLVLAPRVTSIHEMLKSIVNTYSQLASSKGLQLDCQIDESLSRAHLIDALRVAQILNNFTSNAIKFTEHGRVELTAMLMSRQDGSELVCFCVKDSGIGIDKNHQARLFKNYEQATSDTSRMYGGTGLGLAICRRIAELMEGSLSVDSTIGQGSAFCLTLKLPVANLVAQEELQAHLDEDAAHATHPASDVLPLLGDGCSVSILVVDDHPVNRLVLKQQLELLGVQVTTAVSGVPALALWREGAFDAVITDCHMPEMDGYELTHNIRALEQQEHRPRTPIIAWTANVLIEEVQRSLEAGMDDLLTKPTELADLRAKLIKCLGTSSSTEVAVELDAAAVAGAIDFSVLQKIAMRPAAQAEMLQAFNFHNRNDIANLYAALQDANPAAVVRSAHRIKGASYMVGALQLSELALLIETAVSDGDMDTAKHLAHTRLNLAVQQLEAAIGLFSSRHESVIKE
jgi:PAS domain S-box-containing protein